MNINRRLVDLLIPLPTYMASDETDKQFATKAVHSGTNPIGGGVNTPVFLKIYLSNYDIFLYIIVINDWKIFN